MQLRRALIWSALWLGLVTLVACIALVLFTTLLRRNVDEMARAQRAAKVASGLVHQSLEYELETSPTARALSEAYGRLLLSRGMAAARAPDEREAFRALEPQLESHWRGAAARDGRPPRDLVASLVRVEELFAVRAEEKSEQAETLDMVSNVLGIAIAALLAAGVVFFIWVMHQFVSRPIQSLLGSVERFAGGDLSARAPVEGAEEIRRIAIAHNTMADALARTREDQLRYVATVVHDLRNPLAAVQLAVGYVTPERPLPSERRLRDVFQMIDRQLRRLNSMVGDVLNAVQIEAGEIVLRKTACDLGDLAEACVTLFQTMSPYHRFELTRAGPTALVADAKRLEQLLNNLVSNAIKYSPHGSLVRVAVAGVDDSVTLSVTDEGPGISPELRQEVFHPFSRGPSEHEEISGIGLGLYVSKRIIEAHGGTIEVLPASGSGATFRVRLPRGALAAPEDRDEVLEANGDEQWSPA